jgi:hypothetical protein
VGAVDGSFQTTLSLSDGSLMLEDAKTAMGSVEPLARFGASAFGPVEMRAMSADGVTGDWLPLGTLVRLPGFKELRCPRAMAKPCTLTGTNLFLASSIGPTPDFSNATDGSSGEWDAVSETARRSCDSADADPAGDAGEPGRPGIFTGARCTSLAGSGSTRSSAGIVPGCAAAGSAA